MNEIVQEKRRMSRRQRLQTYPIDGRAVRNLTQAGFHWLKTNQKIVNALNVFPVPDGDTGTNMVLTMQSAMDEVNHSDETSMGKVIHAVAQGALMGARGNSGVILSQLWRGFARAVDEKDALSAQDLVAGFVEARETAYKGVVRPVEGTILTVAKDVAAAAEKALKHSNDPVEILEIVVRAAGESVERTPELLPILKEAGVVDSGGKGLFCLLEGMVRWIDGLSLDEGILTGVQPLDSMSLESAMDAIEEGQDYEVVVDFRPDGALDLQKFYGDLEKMGTSIQVGEGDDMYRMHIHVPTENLHQPIDYTMSLGTVTNVAIENLIAQMDAMGRQGHAHELELTPLEPGQIAAVAVSPGPGLSRVFASLGVAAIVEGGQTMNPSTQQILAAFEDLPTSKVIILPNNGNIIMAAEATKEISVKEIEVVKSRSVPQGLAAMLRLDRGGDLHEIAAEMTAALDEVQTGEVTTATRDVEIDGVQVKQGQIIGLHNDTLVVSAETLREACLALLEKMKAKDYELITLFYGADVSQEEAVEIAEAIAEVYPEHEIEVQDGGQLHYQFILSVE